MPSSAALLAGALDAGLTGRVPLDAALADLPPGARRGGAPRLRVDPAGNPVAPPDADERRRAPAPRGNRADTDRYCGLAVDTTDRAAFFAHTEPRPDRPARGGRARLSPATAACRPLGR